MIITHNIILNEDHRLELAEDYCNFGYFHLSLRKTNLGKTDESQVVVAKMLKRLSRNNIVNIQYHLL